MISFGNVSAGAASSGYYNVEGYYARSSDEAQEASQWFGKGAESVGLSGHVEPEAFVDVLNGIAPDGVQLGRGDGKGGFEHKPGDDLTFAPSKSVSVMALIGNDKRIVAAHDKAVTTAMKWIEKEVLQTRARDPETGEIVRRGDQKMLAGLFRHDTNRNMDAHLHTHAVVANMVIDGDGKWRSVQNQSLLNSLTSADTIYNNALASGLKELGYQIHRNGTTSAPHISAVPQIVQDAHSSRRQEVLAELEKSTASNINKASDRAALKTRASKSNNVDRGELYAGWRREAAEMGFGKEEISRLIEGSKEAETPTTEASRLKDAIAATDYAIAHISERQSVYERTDLVNTALGRASVATLPDINAQIFMRTEKGELFDTISDGAAKLTDSKTVALERAVIEGWRVGKGEGARIMDDRAVTQSLSGTSLSEGQQDSLRLSLVSTDRFVGIQGYAGTGKTFMLDKLSSMAAREGFEVVAFAPTNKAVKEVQSVGVEASTLQGFLARYEGAANGRMSDTATAKFRQEYSDKIVFVDESSFVSTAMMADFNAIMNHAQAEKVVLMGDVRQLDAVGAGSPFKALQNAGMQTATMLDIRRQNDPELLAAVYHTIKGEIGDAFGKISENIREVRDPGDKLAAAAAAGREWLTRPEVERSSTLVIAQSNEWRGHINETIRDGLREEGQITGPDHSFDRYAALHFTTAQASVAENYHQGLVVIFERDIKGAGVAKGDTFEVMGVDYENGALKLGNADRELLYQPGRSTQAASAITVYEKERIDLAAGDVIRFDRTDRDADIQNKSAGQIVELTHHAITVQIEGEAEPREIAATSDIMRHVDYGWGATMHGAQGATGESPILAMNAYSPLSTQKSFYVGISRAADDVTLFTNDRNELQSNIAKATGERVDALEVLPERIYGNELDAERDPAGPDVTGNAPDLRPSREAIPDAVPEAFGIAHGRDSELPEFFPELGSAEPEKEIDTDGTKPIPKFLTEPENDGLLDDRDRGHSEPSNEATIEPENRAETASPDGQEEERNLELVERELDIIETEKADPEYEIDDDHKNNRDEMNISAEMSSKEISEETENEPDKPTRIIEEEYER